MGKACQIFRLSVGEILPTVFGVKAPLPALALALAFFSAPAFAAGPAPHATSALGREAGSIYLEDIGIKPVRLTVTGEPVVHSQIANGSYLGILRKGTVAEVVAIADTAVRVRGTSAQGGVVGWVSAAGLTPMKPEFIESVKKNAQRKKDVDALIAKGEVALNMTHEEVASALGKPQKKQTKLDAKGRQEVWEFIRYARVPQESIGRDAQGNLVKSVIYVKVPAGKLSITFDNNLVSALDQTEGVPEVPGGVQLVPAPIVFVN